MGDDCSCECIWTHEMAMRRLLSIIRQGQSYCTDTECIDLPANVPTATRSDDSNFTILAIFMVLSLILYFFQPSSRTQRTKSFGRRDPPSGDTPPAVN